MTESTDKLTERLVELENAHVFDDSSEVGSRLCSCGWKSQMMYHSEGFLDWEIHRKNNAFHQLITEQLALQREADAFICEDYSPAMPESEWGWNAVFGVRMAERILASSPDLDAAHLRIGRKARLDEARQWLMSEGLGKQLRLEWKVQRIKELETK